MQIEIPKDRLAFVINCRDRLTDLKELVHWALEVNTYPIKLVIIDNNSTYKPLFDFYFRLKKEYPISEIVYLPYNAGAAAIDKIKLKGGLPYYIYTDCDTIPDKTCPPDAIQHLINLSSKYSSVHKIGLSLRIDDLPDDYPFLEEVILNEPIHSENINSDRDAYVTDVLSSFALYRKNYSRYNVSSGNLRTLEPYVAKHNPWYLDPKKLPEDYIHYIKGCTSDSFYGMKFGKLLNEKSTMTKGDKYNSKDFMTKLVDKKFNYKTVTGLNIPIMFTKDCTVIGDGGEKGRFSFIGKRVRIIWEEKLQSTDILNFNTAFDKYTGSSSRYGSIRGKVLKNSCVQGLFRKIEHGKIQYITPEITIIAFAYGIPSERKLNFLRWNKDLFVKEKANVYLLSDKQENLSDYPFARIIEYPEDEEAFSLPKIFNYGLKQITKTEIVVKTDIDIIFSKSIFRQMRQTISNKVGMVCIPFDVSSFDDIEQKTNNWDNLSRNKEHKGGCFAMTYDDWLNLGGYDESLISLDINDSQMYLRASKKIKMYISEVYPLWHVNHPKRKVVTQQRVINELPTITKKKSTDKFIKQLIGKSYTYKSKSDKTIITFLDETTCIGWDNLIFGVAKSKHHKVRISWKESDKGISILEFNPSLEKYSGICTVDGNIFGEFSHDVHASVLADLCGRINEDYDDYTIDNEINDIAPGKTSIILYMNYYVDPDSVRDKEIKECFFNNLKNPLINKIVCFKDYATPIPSDSRKIEYVVFDERPTYNNFFSAMRSFSRSNSINILINSDIHFDSSLKLLLKHNFKKDQCFAISRWEAGKTLKMAVGRDSQDVWVIKGKPVTTLCANFCLGIAGCDNRMAFEMKRAGYDVSNPSQSVKCIHVHQSQLRRYSKKPSDCVSGPYLLLPQTSLKG